MDAVQQQLDVSYLVKNFEQHVIDNGNATDNVFDNAKGLYIWGELEYKYMCANRISNAPSHACTQETCAMRRVAVAVYRRIKHGAVAHASHAPHATIDMGFATNTQLAVYHMCFMGECAHLRPNHFCEDPAACPHLHSYDANNTRVLDNFWVCTSTGNVHMCGALCCYEKAVAQYENHFVCKLTGTIVSTNISHEQSDQYVNKMITANEEYAQPAHLTPLSGRGRMAKTLLLTNIKLWEDSEQLRNNIKDVHAICEILLFSHERQMMEATAYLQKYEHAYTETIRALSAKRADGAPINVAHAMRVFRECSFTSPYFATVPMRPEIKTHVNREVAALDTMYAVRQPVQQTPAYTLSRMGMYTTVERHRSTHEGCATKQPVQWDNKEWQDGMKNVKDMIAHTVVNVWVNLNKHATQNAADPSEEPADFTNFKRLIMPIMYMTREGYAIPDHTLHHTDAAQLVSVVPEIEFAKRLPPESKLVAFKYSSINAHADSTHHHAPRRSRSSASSSAVRESTFLRKMTPAQKTIKKTLNCIARDGKLTDIKLTLEDVCSQILKLNTVK